MQNIAMYLSWVKYCENMKPFVDVMKKFIWFWCKTVANYVSISYYIVTIMYAKL